MEVARNLLESPSYAPPYSSSPTLGFPLGTALLLIVVFSLSGVFSCCYHWDKLRHLRRSAADDNHQSPSKTSPNRSEKKRNEKESLPVIMAGDRIARFIAMPCPCEPPREEKIAVEVVEAPPKPAPPQIGVPMYI